MFANNAALDKNDNIDNMAEDISMLEVDDAIGVNIPRYCNEKHIKFSLDLFLFDFWIVFSEIQEDGHGGNSYIDGELVW